MSVYEFAQGTSDWSKAGMRSPGRSMDVLSEKELKRLIQLCSGVLALCSVVLILAICH